MKNAVFGALLVMAGALAVAPTAKAQSYGYGYGYAPPPPAWEHEGWHEHRARREYRREFWRQQRELAERRAYEAGQRDAYRHQQPAWAYR
ncbi:hypothetical protein [Roseomonas populi]|uniref:Uncharacterized protein n=1 Tax=Roseomonas populi TaxID=3121582 RepID=A0ABT1XBR5_9PROT|nr:hypothetical protein [Roseomonas pecuniae]MCR0985186.1 hypothetical protein [Roseomonas pecuniae]